MKTLQKFQFLALALPVLVQVADAMTDLSQPWRMATKYNQNELYCKLQDMLVENGDIVGYVAIQEDAVDGAGLAIVAEGYNTNIASDVADFDSIELNPLWSATKSWSSLLVGVLVDEGLLELDTTLGHVFAAEADVWDGIIDAQAKQTLTIQEILTMTTGLIETSELGEAQDTSLKGVLNSTAFDLSRRGMYEYLPTNHLISRIIVAATDNRTPLQIANEAVFPALGLEDGVDFVWDQFGNDNVEGSAFGLHSNPRTLAKLGALYLQNGFAAAGDADQIVSPEWILASMTNQLQAIDTPDNNPWYQGYGYQWYTDPETDEGDNAQASLFEGSFAVVGGGRQTVIVFPSAQVILAVMTKFDATSQLGVLQASRQATELVNAATQSLANMENMQDGQCVNNGIESSDTGGADNKDGEPLTMPTSSPTTLEPLTMPTSSPTTFISGSPTRAFQNLLAVSSPGLLVLFVGVFGGML